MKQEVRKKNSAKYKIAACMEVLYEVADMKYGSAYALKLRKRYGGCKVEK